MITTVFVNSFCAAIWFSVFFFVLDCFIVTHNITSFLSCILFDMIVDFNSRGQKTVCCFLSVESVHLVDLLNL